MKTIEEIRENKLAGAYKAICENGKEYDAYYVNEYGGMMFFAVPEDENIAGYIPA